MRAETLAPPPPTTVERVRAQPAASAARFPVWSAPALRSWTPLDPRGLVTKLEAKGEREVAARLERLGIEKLTRFKSPDLLLEVMRNRETDGAGDPRRRALLIFPKFDDTGVFDENPMENLRTHNHRVLYYEAGADADFIAIMEAEAQNEPVSFFEIAGHGSPVALAFDNHKTPGQTGLPPEADLLDWSDLEDLLAAKTRGLLTEDAVIQLNSCSTGYSKEGFPSPANLIARVFPRNRIYAPTVNASSTPVFERSGAFVSPGYRVRDASHVYAIEPKPEPEGIELILATTSRR